MKRLFVLALAVLILLPLAGCVSPHLQPELHIVALQSLLGVSEAPFSGHIFILQEDDFGRVMFAYAGRTALSDNRNANINILAVLIIQRASRRYSYFYDGVNTISREIALQSPAAVDEAFVMEHFLEEELQQLKAENDWNEELNEDRFFRVQVARRGRGPMTNVSREIQRDVFEAVSEGFLDAFSRPLTMDKNGNVIYVIRGSNYDSNRQEWTFYSTFLFMFDSDGELIEGAVMELEDLWDYRDQLREFKEAHGWSFYWR